MPVFVLDDAQFYFDGYDLSGDTNQISLDLTGELLDKTTFGGDGWRSRTSGLLSTELTAAGLLNMGDAEVDDILFDNLAATNTVITASASGDDGDVAYTFKAIHARYTHRGNIGELAAWDMAGMARDTAGVVRGNLLHDKSTARTATGDGAGRQLGDVTATESLYATLHVLAASGTTPTLDVKVQSDDNAGFTSATDRITFSQATAVGAQWATPVAGAITDDHWRIVYTIGGTDPSFTFAVVVGIK